jgi:hypothetical protein
LKKSVPKLSSKVENRDLLSTGAASPTCPKCKEKPVHFYNFVTVKPSFRIKFLAIVKDFLVELMNAPCLTTDYGFG